MFDHEAFVNLPQDQETAAQLLKLARDNGYDESVIRTSDDGFAIPADLIDKLFPPEKKKGKAHKAEPAKDAPAAEPEAPAEASTEGEK